MPKIWRLILTFGLTALLTACAYNPSSNNNYQPPAPQLLAANTYLQMAEQSVDEEQQQDYRLLALERLVQDRKNTQATKLLKTLRSEPLTPEQQAQKQLLTADLQLTQNKIPQATKTLQAVAASNVILSDQQQVKLHTLLANAYADKGLIAESLAEHAMALPLIKNQYAYNREVLATWQLLQKQNLRKLQALMIQNPTPNLRGWLQLAILAHQPNANGKQFMRNIEGWQAKYSNHAAQAILPKRLDWDKLVTNDIPKNVAVLLPLHGALATSAGAIRNGFLAAYFSAKTNYQQTPNLTFYDTSADNVNNVYQSAIEQGANFVVGPLTKPNVEKLVIGDNISTPTLALNTISSSFNPNRKYQLPTNLYQFGLSPIDEAVQIANLAWQQRHSNALIVAPANKRGQQIAKAIGLRWQKLGGDVVADLAYNGSNNLSRSIQQLLTVDQSQARIKSLEKTLGQRMRSLPRRRQDVDCIFLVAQPTIGRQIQPLFKYFFAGNIPIFATSSIYSGSGSKRDQDLNEVLFTDMPWVLADNQQFDPDLAAIRGQLKKLYPNSFQRYSKLYALGVDAYNVIPELNMLAVLPNFGNTSATGTLYLDKQQHLYRRLLLAQMHNGRPRLLSHG